MDNLYDLPNGWEWKKLEEVCRFINGRAYKKEELLSDGKYPVLRVGNFFTNNNWFYSDLELPSDKYCENGDLLYAWSASFGPKIWNGEKSIYHYHIWKIIPNDKFVNKDFLYYLLDWDVEKIKADQGTGTTMMHVTKGSIESRMAAIPPLIEQQRVVKKIDSLFEKIDKSIALHQKSIDEANALMGSVLNEVFGKLEEKYKKIFVKDIAKTIQSGFAVNKSNEIENGYVHLRTHNISTNGKINLNTIIAVNKDMIKANLSYIEKDDILFNNTNSTELVGKTAIVEENNNYAFSNHLTKIQLFENMDSKFFVYSFQLLFKQKYFESICNKWIGQSGINNSMLKEIQIPLPPLSIQQKVVEYLDSISEKMEKVKSIQKEKMASLKALKASILDSAFRGEL